MASVSLWGAKSHRVILEVYASTSDNKNGSGNTHVTWYLKYDTGKGSVKVSSTKSVDFYINGQYYSRGWSGNYSKTIFTIASGSFDIGRNLSNSSGFSIPFSIGGAHILNSGGGFSWFGGGSDQQSSVWADAITAWTSIGAPGTPSVPSRIVPGRSFTISWAGASAGTNNPVKSYYVYYRVSRGSSQYYSSTSGTSMTINLSPSRGALVDFYVTAISTYGSNTSSGWSSDIRVNTLPVISSVTGVNSRPTNSTDICNFTINASACSGGSIRKRWYRIDGQGWVQDKSSFSYGAETGKVQFCVTDDLGEETYTSWYSWDCNDDPKLADTAELTVSEKFDNNKIRKIDMVTIPFTKDPRATIENLQFSLSWMHNSVEKEPYTQTKDKIFSQNFINGEVKEKKYYRDKAGTQEYKDAILGDPITLTLYEQNYSYDKPTVQDGKVIIKNFYFFNIDKENLEDTIKINVSIADDLKESSTKEYFLISKNSSYHLSYNYLQMSNNAPSSFLYKNDWKKSSISCPSLNNFYKSFQITNFNTYNSVPTDAPAIEQLAITILNKETLDSAIKIVPSSKKTFSVLFSNQELSSYDLFLFNQKPEINHNINVVVTYIDSLGQTTTRVQKLLYNAGYTLPKKLRFISNGHTGYELKPYTDKNFRIAYIYDAKNKNNGYNFILKGDFTTSKGKKININKNIDLGVFFENKGSMVNIINDTITLDYCYKDSNLYDSTFLTQFIPEVMNELITEARFYLKIENYFGWSTDFLPIVTENGSPLFKIEYHEKPHTKENTSLDFITTINTSTFSVNSKYNLSLNDYITFIEPSTHFEDYNNNIKKYVYSLFYNDNFIDTFDIKVGESSRKWINKNAQDLQITNGSASSNKLVIKVKACDDIGESEEKTFSSPIRLCQSSAPSFEFSATPVDGTAGDKVLTLNFNFLQDNERSLFGDSPTLQNYFQLVEGTKGFIKYSVKIESTIGSTTTSKILSKENIESTTKNFSFNTDIKAATRVYLRYTITMTTKGGGTITFPPYDWIFYNEAPTISPRPNHLGINVVGEEMNPDEVLTIYGKDLRQKIKFLGEDGIPILFDLTTHQIDNVIIDGGSWT